MAKKKLDKSEAVITEMTESTGLTTQEDIFKVQRPMDAGGDLTPKCILIYNQSQSTITQVDFTDDLKAAFGNEYKIYVKGKFENGRLVIAEKLPWQLW